MGDLTKEKAKKLVEIANEKRKEKVNREEYKDMDPDREYLKKKQGADFKPAGAVLGILAMGALGAKAYSKAKKKSSASPDSLKYTIKDKNMVTDLYQKATKQKTAMLSSGGEIEVGKGKDYIKDLID